MFHVHKWVGDMGLIHLYSEQGEVYTTADLANDFKLVDCILIDIFCHLKELHLHFISFSYQTLEQCVHRLSIPG